MAQGNGPKLQTNRTAPKKISLIKGFSSAINLPRHTGPDGDYPLYPHGEGSKVTMQRSQAWYKAAESTYNSPSNVRVVCLSRDGANVFYWASTIKGNKMVPQLESASPYVFDKTAKSGVEQHINKNQYVWENAGLQALVNPVVLSNLEELWISSEILACPKYMQYYNQLSVLKPGQLCGADFLASILEEEISTPTKKRTIADTFPLLRAIVVVKTVENSPVQDFHKCAMRTEEVKKFLDAKYPGKRTSIGESVDVMIKVANDSTFGFAVQPITTGDILKFSLGDYKYDQRVLSGLKEKIVKKYTPKAVSNTTVSMDAAKETVSVGKSVSVSEEGQGIVTSAIENYLNNAVAMGKTDARLKLILSAYAVEYGVETLKDEFRYFTPEGKKRYGKLFV